MKEKILEGLLIITAPIMIIINELLCQIIYPIIILVMWILLLPVKLILIAIKSDKLTMYTDEFEKKLEDMKSNWLVHYSLTYLIAKSRYKFAMKFGCAL